MANAEVEHYLLASHPVPNVDFGGEPFDALPIVSCIPQLGHTEDRTRISPCCCKLSIRSPLELQGSEWVGWSEYRDWLLEVKGDVEVERKGVSGGQLVLR